MRRLARALPVLLGLLAYSAPADAAFTEKTMRQPLPRKAIERALILPKGWVEFELGYSRKTATGNWGADGSRQEWSNSEWIFQTQRAALTVGFGNRAEFYFSMPYHQGRLNHTSSGLPGDTDWSTSAHGIGDPRLGWRLQFINEEVPRRSVALETEVKGSAASEGPGTFLGGPLNVATFIFTTGSMDGYVGLAAKQQFGPTAVTARLGYMHRFSSIVQYIIETENQQFLGRIKPGDLLLASVGVQASLGPLALGVTPSFYHRQVTKVGTTSPGTNPNKYLDPVAESDGIGADLRVDAQFNASRAFDVTVFANLPLMGQDFQFFPIEDLQPTLGTTLGGVVEVRY